MYYVLGAVDVTALQDEINELQYHNKRLSENLVDVRNQVDTVEEHNIDLQAEVERLNKKLQQ